MKKGKECHMKRNHFITNKFTSKGAQYFFNKLTGHWPYIGLLFIWGIWNSGMNIV